MRRAIGFFAVGAMLAGPLGAQSPPAPSASGWVARGAAELQILDKVNARVAIQTVRPGQNLRHGAIVISVQSCFLRAPDQAPDAAAFLVITDDRPGASGFRGWMFAATPMLGMLEHPIYDIRVLTCRP